MNFGVLFWRFSAILHARMFNFKVCVCSKIVLKGCFSFWSSRHCAPTWFNGLLSLKLLPRQIQILSLLDDAISFLLLPLLHTSESEKTKKSITSPKILGVVKVQEIKTAPNQKLLFCKIGVLKFAIKTLEKNLWRTFLFCKVAG